MAGPKNASSDNSCEPDHPSRTWIGASACVPTCGLELYEETLTLAPALINEAHPHVNGVSPGHSGVSGLSMTLMSRRVGSLPFTDNLGVWIGTPRQASTKLKQGADSFAAQAESFHTAVNSCQPVAS